MSSDVITNVILVLATFALAYIGWHVSASWIARRQGVSPPAFFDYKAHRALSSSEPDVRRDPWFWIIMFVAVAIVVTLTKPLSFGVGFMVAGVFGLIVGGAYSWARNRRSDPPTGRPRSSSDRARAQEWLRARRNKRSS
jgi:hypothetical protein